MERVYEGMFVVSPTAGDGDKPLEAVKRILGRAQAQVLVCKLWEERKLAYEIRRQKRGTYVLTYFKADGNRIADIERDVQLADDVLRVLILDASGAGEQEMNAPTPAETGRSTEQPLGAGEEAEFDRPRRPPPPPIPSALDDTEAAEGQPRRARP